MSKATKTSTGQVADPRNLSSEGVDKTATTEQINKQIKAANKNKSAAEKKDKDNGDES